jgi:endonuclease/exonuclease/phosphatase family metal-dependent hydrolase
LKIKLINLNTWFGGKNLWDNIVQYLQTEQPDILMLQEAYLGKNPSVPPHLRTVSALQELLSYPFAEYEAQHMIRGKDNETPMGNAILSKFPLTHKNTIWLYGDKATLVEADKPELIPTFPRNILHCQATINGNEYNLMTMQGVWADSGVETTSQKQAGRKIFEYIQNKNNIILAGDFNVNENCGSINLIEQSLVNLFKGQRTSSFNMKHKAKPGYAQAIVDFVFTSPNIKISEFYTADADVSDHQSQIVVFDL